MPEQKNKTALSQPRPGIDLRRFQLFFFSSPKPKFWAYASGWMVGLLIIEGLLVAISSADPQITEQGEVARAAIATPALKLSDNLGFVLPQTKAQAQEFSRTHASPYNFDELGHLRSEHSAAPSYLPATSSSLSSSALSTPNPTSTSPSFSRPDPGSTSQLTGEVTRLKKGPVLNAPPAPGTCGPGSVVSADSFEVDDAPAQAKSISVGTAPSQFVQTHTLTGVGTTAPTDPGADVDWIKFQITNLNATYTIQTSNLNPTPDTANGINGLDTVIELYKGNAAGVTGPYITINDNYSTTLASQIVYTPVSGDDNSAVFFYVRVYGKPNISCTGSYDFSVFTTPLATPTATSTPVSPTPDSCRDAYEYDDTPSQAKELRVSNSSTPPFGGTPGLPDAPSPNNNIQLHYICPVGDIDWVYVDLVKGKPYSIFTAALSGGLDTLMVLFEMDDKGNLNPIYSNDDFPGMGLASRIDFIVPNTPANPNGEYKRYWVAVKDVSGHGGPLLSYSLVLTSPGSNQFDCLDQYEPDGLPNLAKEILVNETQIHTLCPAGDADWVKFFAKAGRTYNLKTSFGPVPGLDTYMYVFSILFDPNDPTRVISQNLLASNDDVSPTDLSSAVNFSVPEDGYYYAQVKNNGDIGKTGFYYQLTYSVAGVALVTPNIPATQTAAALFTAGATASARAGATATGAAARTATATALGTPGPTATGYSGFGSILDFSFADPAFEKLWYYTDLAVSQNQAQRSWEWGPKPGVVLREPYAESPGGFRQVQYFDKSRMEINQPKGERTNPWFVTNGLLVKEMVSGQVALGDNLFDQRRPATIPVAGDLTASNPAPTYASFNALITLGDHNRAVDLTGQVVNRELSANGQVVAMTQPPELAKNAVYIKETGHNIPAVFYDYLNSTGSVYDNGYKEGSLRNWVFAMGYPLSEPYWITTQVGGEDKTVLVQLFERRVLTYTPGNDPQWRVEMANVGQHYYLWRYNKSF